LVGTFFDVSYSKTALSLAMLVFTWVIIFIICIFTKKLMKLQCRGATNFMVSSLELQKYFV
jgi:hypothetical protein